MASWTIPCQRFCLALFVIAPAVLPACDRPAPTSPAVTRALSKDAMLEHATEIAQAHMDEFIAALTADVRDLDHRGFLVLVELETNNTNTAEVWISAKDYENGQFTCIIDDLPPDVTAHSISDELNIARTDIVDWMYNDGDTLVGGWTVRVQIDFSDYEQRQLMMQRLNLSASDLQLPPPPPQTLPNPAPPSNNDS